MKKEEFLEKLGGLDIQDGNLSDTDALALIEVAKLVNRPKNHFLEIGSWKGKSTACLAAVVAKQNGTVWTVDHFKGSEGTKEADAACHTDIFQIFKQNMSLVNASEIVVPIIGSYKKVMDILPYHFFNLVYIDADNRYEEMKFLLNALKRRVKSRGIICGRNLLYDYPDRKTFVDEEIDKEYSSKYKLHPGIIKAVHEAFKGGYDRFPNSTIWYKKKT